MSFNIEVQGGSSVRLPTAGKYCDRDIIVTATGGGGGAEPVIEPLEITENGTYTAPDGVDGYSPVTVNVPTGGGGGDIDALLDGTITEINSNGPTTIRQGAFEGYLALTTINFPAVTSISANAFKSCPALTTANFPVATRIARSAFYSCAALTTINFPAVTSIEVEAFYDCRSLTTANFPKVTGVGSYVFQKCSALKTGNFPVATSIGTNAFYDCRSLTALILRNTNQGATLSSSYAFAKTPIASGTGYIYVPRDLVDSYKSASNWSNYASQFRAIEDYPEITGG